MRLILYARKSSEGEDRQVQSLDDQTRLLRAHAIKHGLLVVEEMAESKSAKDPYRRPLFEGMLQQIEQGKADGILCWHLNRLFRNLVDSGRVGHLLQQGRIQAIETPERAYRPEDNVLLFSVESGMANQFIRELSKGVRRGMASKVEKGWAPQLAPQGYLNDLYEHTIVADPERFALLRQAWDLMLTGTVTVPQMLARLNGEWGFRTRQDRHRGGTPLSLPSAYRMLHSVFYAGRFLREGALYEGQHPAMVTMEEWERVQTILAREGGARYRKHAHAYTGMIRCGRCGSRITAEVSKGQSGKGHYVYYHCTNRHGVCDKKGVTEKELERQIVSSLEGVRLNPQVEELLADVIGRWQAEPGREAEKRYAQLHRTLEAARSQQRELIGLRLKKLIDDELLQAEQERLTGEILGLEREVGRLGTAMTRQVESAVRSIHFAAHARARFEAGAPQTRRQIFQTLGVSFVLAGRDLRIERHPLLEFLGEHREALNALPVTEKSATEKARERGTDSARFEPVKNGSGSTKKTPFLASVSFGGADRTLTELCRQIIGVAGPLPEPFPSFV